MTEIVVLRAVLLSVFFVLAMKGMQYVARDKFGLVISNVMITWISSVVIAIAIFDGKLFSNMTRAVVYFAGMFVAFLLATLVQASKKGHGK